MQIDSQSPDAHKNEETKEGEKDKEMTDEEKKKKEEEEEKKVVEPDT
jgi:26S proteasome regulatory subunit N2